LRSLFSLHLHLHSTSQPEVEQALALIAEEMGRMSAQLEALRQEVHENQQIGESAIALITGLAQQIRDNAEDPAALRQLAEDLDTQNASLAAAVAANTTPPAPAPPAEGGSGGGGGEEIPAESAEGPTS